MVTVSTATATAGTAVGQASSYLVTERVRGGIYVGSGADWRSDFAGANVRSFTSYASLAQTGTAIYPGADWRAALIASGLLFNLVVELKWYGAGSTVAGQAFKVEGKSYTVPAPNGRIQRRAGTTFPVAWSYDQVLAGQCDGLLHRLLVELRKIPATARVNIQFASEVDTDNEFGTSASTDRIYTRAQADTLAVRTYEYMIRWMRQPPAGISPLPRPGPVTFSVGWSGAWSGLDGFLTLHPETLPVDYVQWNCYNQNGNLTAYERLTPMMASYRRLGPVMRAKPIIIAEWGTNPAHPGGQGPWIDTWPAAVQRVNAEQVQRGEGQILVTNYFDSGYGLLTPRPAGIAALKRAYAAIPFR